MKAMMTLVRLGGFCIDTLLVMVPTQLVTLDYLKLTPMQAQIYFVILFAVYGAVTTQACHGMTAGKYFAKLEVLSRDGSRPSLMYLGLRELMKGMYFLPLIGPILAVVSVGLYLWKGTTLHDSLGQTQVVTRRKAEMIRSQEG